MAIDRVRVLSTGFSGATGYTNFYFSSATTSNIAALRTMFLALQAYVPTSVTYTFPSSGDTINEADGHLVGSWTATPPASVTGTSAAAYAAPAGFTINWRISGVIDGHRPIAKTFIVPGAAASQSTTGGPSAAVISAGNTAAANFLSAATGFVLWHRPVFNRATTPPALTRTGAAVAIISGAVGPKTVVLRSRRD